MPAKQPKKHHQKVGNYRPGAHRGPELPVKVPPCPADLGPTATAFWNVLTDQLFRAGLIAEIDLTSLRIMSESWERYRDAQDAYKEHGPIITSESKYHGTIRKKNPAIDAIHAETKVLLPLIKQFGLTPVARTGIDFGEIDSGDDEEARVLSIIGG